MDSNTAVEWPSAVVAVALIALVGTIMIVAMIRYKQADALKIWGALGTILGVIVGMMTTYFFTHRTIAKLEWQVAQAQIVSDEPDVAYAFGKFEGLIVVPTDLEIWRALSSPIVGTLHEKSPLPGRVREKLIAIATATRVLLWPDNARKIYATLEAKAESDERELTKHEAAQRNYLRARKLLAEELTRVIEADS